MRFVSFTCHFFERQTLNFNQESNPQPENFKPQFYPAELTRSNNHTVSQRFSFLLLSSDFTKSQDSNPQPPDQFIRHLNVLPLTDSRIQHTELPGRQVSEPELYFVSRPSQLVRLCLHWIVAWPKHQFSSSSLYQDVTLLLWDPAPRFIKMMVALSDS